MVLGCIIDVTAVPRVSQCAEMQRTAVGTGNSLPSCLHSFVQTFVSIAFIGLPWPINSTGIRSDFGKLASDVNVASTDTWSCSYREAFPTLLDKNGSRNVVRVPGAMVITMRCLWLLCSLQLSIDSIPVHNIPPSLEVVGTLVPVLQVVGMFLDIIAEDWNSAIHVRVVLIWCADDLKLSSLRACEPNPPRTEALEASIFECSLELFV